MIFDFITYDTKILIAVLAGAIWIYNRDKLCYVMIPRRRILPVVFVSLWIYLNYKDPLFLPIGLLILCAVSTFYRN